MEGLTVNHETTPPPLRDRMRAAAEILGGRIVELHVKEPRPLPPQQGPTLAQAPTAPTKSKWAGPHDLLQQMEAMAVAVLDEANELDDSLTRKSFVRRVKRVRRTVNGLVVTAAHGGRPPPDERQLILPLIGGDGRTAMTPNGRVRWRTTVAPFARANPWAWWGMASSATP